MNDMTVKEFVSSKKEELRKEVETLEKVPFLTIIRVGDDPASVSYTKGKIKDAEEVGFHSEMIVLDENVTQSELLKIIQEKNADTNVDGILVQLPLPKHISTASINDTINPKKDVDGFTPNSRYTPCTPKGIVTYLEAIGFDFDGKNAVVLGRSQIVGLPMAKLLISKNMNVTVLHSHTSLEDKKFYIKHADLIVVAIGKLGYLDNSYEYNRNAVIVDVGINRDENGKLHGDAAPGLPVRLQTPVPGGVGLLTRLALLMNLLEASKK